MKHLLYKGVRNVIMIFTFYQITFLKATFIKAMLLFFIHKKRKAQLKKLTSQV